MDSALIVRVILPLFSLFIFCTMNVSFIPRKLISMLSPTSVFLASSVGGTSIIKSVSLNAYSLSKFDAFCSAFSCVFSEVSLVLSVLVNPKNSMDCLDF